MTARAPTTWQDAVAAAGRELGPDAVTELALTPLRRELPLVDEDAELLEAARASTRANIDLAVALALGQVDLDDVQAPAQAAVFARELARRGVPVAQLDRAYRVAQLALWRWAVATVRERLEGDLATPIERLSEAILATGDVLTAAVMDRYAQEREQWLRSAEALRAETVGQLLSGAAVDVDAASSRLGVDLRRTHLAFVVSGPDEVTAPDRTVAVVAPGRPLLHPLGPAAVAGWTTPDGLRPDLLPEGFRLALGTPDRDVAGFRTSHVEALEARRVAQLLASAGPVTRYADVALLALLTRDLEQARRFVRDRLGRLAAGDAVSVRLAETLHVALEEQGSPRRTAQRLGVHENTVAKRLRAIDELLGGTRERPAAELLAALTILPVVRARAADPAAG